MADDELLALARARIGRVLRGKYRLDRVLGIGGMAVVYAATHRNKKKFAIKMLHPELSVRENIRTRFLREGYVANSVEHSGAVAVLDDDIAEDGSAFVVMELLEGSPIDEVWQKQGKRVPLPLVLAIGDAVLDVLAAAHAKGIVHRDIKPANLFLTNDGRVEVLDFGIARLHDETSSAAGATQTGAMLGTPAYMAPEQALAESSKVDAQTDLWAVGATLFALLTGELVHAGDNASQLLVNAATKKARGLASVADEVPKAVALVVDKALAFDKAERWASAKEMREALQKGCVEATGGPIPPLPKTAAVTGLEDTVTSNREVSGTSSGIGFDPTLPPETATPDGPTPAAATPVGQTTGAVMASTKESEVSARWSPPWRMIAMGGSACAAVAAVATAMTLARRPRVALCADWQYAIDGLRCVTPLPLDAMKKRFRSWRLTSVSGRITAAESVNWVGARVEDTDTRLEIERGDDGSVRQIVTSDPHGNVVAREIWSNGGKRVDYVEEDGKTPRHRYIRGYGELPPVTTVLREFDPQGYVARETYLGASGHPRPIENGWYGVTHHTGRAGRDIKTQVLAADGQPGAEPAGASIFESSDDDSPDGMDQRLFDLAGKAACNRQGIHHVRSDLDEAYQRKGVFNFGPQETPAVILQLGTHGLLEHFDATKRIFEKTGVDERGHPRPFKGDAASIESRSYDDRGREAVWRSLDANRNAVINHDHSLVATTRYAYDDRDNVADLQQMDPSGALMLDDVDMAHRTATFDDRGRLVEKRYFDVAGKPTIRREMGAIVRFTYDDRGLATSEAYFDGDAHPLANKHGYASIRMKYDRLRNEVERAFFDPDGRPCTDDDGVSVLRHVYDDNDDLVTVLYFDASGAPVVHDGEWATKRIKNDERGLPIEEAYFDAHGEPTTLKDGYARVTYVRDRSGDAIEEAYFGKRGEPVARAGGYASKKTTYDIHRLAIETKLYGVKAELAPGADGWAIERIAYDERALPVRHDHFDAAGNPVLTKGGASDTKTYDARGNAVEEATLGVHGEPVVAERAGYAAKKSAYDERDELVEEALLGADAKPTLGKDGWSIRKLRYDEAGNVIEEAFFDADRRPVAPKDKTFASARSRFDARQHLVESSYFDASGAPAKGPDGAATVRYEPDPFGRAAQTAYFEGAGAPAPSKDGKLVVRSKYDDAGRLVGERYVDASGAPRAAADGCFGHHTKYDMQGRKIEESCLDSKESPIFCVDGWAIRRTLHDARGNDVDVATYSPDGSLHADKDGVAHKKNSFDERNLLKESIYFDAADKPTRDKRGVHSVRFTYDDAGKKTGETSYDDRSHAVASPAPAKTTP